MVKKVKGEKEDEEVPNDQSDRAQFGVGREEEEEEMGEHWFTTVI